jgi:TolB-like protein
MNGRWKVGRLDGWKVGTVLLSIIPTFQLSAQCPDGSPPPCAPAPARAAPVPNSVAVLYFENVSRDSADAYLADGLTEAIIVRLSQIERLAVKSSSAVRRFRGRLSDDPAVLGRALGSAHLVSGSVRRAGTRVRVTVNLVRAATGVQVWGEQYDRSDVDLLALEQEIARAVATGIAGRLLPRERVSLAARPTRSPAAYDRYLRGNYYLARRTPEGFARALDAYDAALALDREFASPLARIALIHALYVDWGWPYKNVPRDSMVARGLAAAERLLGQDSMISDGWLARGMLLSFKHPRTFDGAVASLERAIALDPENAEAHHFLGVVRNRLGDHRSAAAAFQRALGLDAERAITAYNVAFTHLIERRYREAGPWLDSALVIDSTFYLAYSDRARARLRLDDPAGARADAEAAWRVAPPEARHTAAAALALVAARTGDTVAARAWASELRREVLGAAGAAEAGLGPRHAHSLALALIAVGDVSGTLDVLERARPPGAQFWQYLRAPEYDGIRSHSRFQRLVEESRPPGVP